MATTYLHRNAARKPAPAASQKRFLLSCQAAAYAHSPKAKKGMLAQSRVAMRAENTAGASTANTIAEASPTAGVNKRRAKPHTEVTVTRPRTAARARTPAR